MQRKDENFYSVPVERRAVFLPHCLCAKGCIALKTDEGIVCRHCKRCGISDFLSFAEEKGYKVFVVPGGSMIKRLVKKHKIEGVLGVACIPELEEGIELADRKGLSVVTVPLKKDGCVCTEVDWDELRGAL